MKWVIIFVLGCLTGVFVVFIYGFFWWGDGNRRVRDKTDMGRVVSHDSWPLSTPSYLFDHTFYPFFLPLIPESTLTLAYQYNLFILLGNLLPILPLDGGRLVQLMGDHLLPYQASHMFSIVVSVVTIGLGLIITYSTGILSLSLLLLFIFFIIGKSIRMEE